MFTAAIATNLLTLAALEYVRKVALTAGSTRPSAATG